nr:OF23721 [Phoebe bournei]
MHDISNMESKQGLAYSTSPCAVGCPSRWSSTGSAIPQSSVSGSLNLNLDSATQRCQHAKQLGLRLRDQESSSTQSTGQSHHEMASMGLVNSHGHYISGQSGYDETLGRQVNGHMKSVLSLGTPDLVFSSAKVDYTQPVACVPYPYANPYVSGALAAYGPQTVIHPQMLGIMSTRVPLPLDFADDEPIYVNAKQYRAILRRREARAKLEAQNKVVKARKPYLHESRHLHAMKRVRGSGGRFLNMKKLQPSDHSPHIEDANISSGSALLQLGGSLTESEALQLENSNGGASATCSDVTSVSINDGIFQKANIGLSGFHSYTRGNLQHGGGIVHSGAQHRVSVIQ